ncbi:hypothetical protein MNBD_NITROSPINAE04-845 [hydrothermal vent metagenome]|uniref:RND transporter n=1 Tax=hydrothermal vent metagenome TaxID=652676 RepID=A0A3B1BFH7_9ZZZZ
MLDSIPYPLLIIIAVFMAVAPAFPMPHLVEKLIMLKNGALNNPLDIFDLILHSAPLLFLVAKLLKDYALKS